MSYTEMRSVDAGLRPADGMQTVSDLSTSFQLEIARSTSNRTLFIAATWSWYRPALPKSGDDAFAPITMLSLLPPKAGISFSRTWTNSEVLSDKIFRFLHPARAVACGACATP